MIEAVIFDMDGLLLDSEPFWQEAEIETFRSVGVPLTLEMCLQTTGIRVGEVIPYWHERYPWNGKSFSVVEEEILWGVEKRIRERGAPNPGVSELLRDLPQRGVRMALASSSSFRLINAVLEKFGWRETFDVVHSAEKEEYGKPHPAVFLSTAKQLEATPGKCLVLEDSFPGVLAAKAAKMKCVAVPMAAQLNDPRFVIADLTLPSLTAFGEAEWERLQR